MTAITQSRLNVTLALAIPAGGFMYLAYGVPVTARGSAAAALVALGVLWMTAIVALNTVRRPHPVVVGRAATEHVTRFQSIPSGVIDVSRARVPWRWTSGILAPLELLAVAWIVPLVIFVIAAAVGLTVASGLWVGRLIFRL